MLTFENPMLAIWIWTGAIHGRYWFAGHEEIDIAEVTVFHLVVQDRRSQKPGIPE